MSLALYTNVNNNLTSQQLASMWAKYPVIPLLFSCSNFTQHVNLDFIFPIGSSTEDSVIKAVETLANDHFKDTYYKMAIKGNNGDLSLKDYISKSLETDRNRIDLQLKVAQGCVDTARWPDKVAEHFQEISRDYQPSDGAIKLIWEGMMKEAFCMKNTEHFDCKKT